MATQNQAVATMLGEIHGLLHEAKSNVEIDVARGQKLIDQVAAAEAAQKSGALTSDALGSLVKEIDHGINASVEKELSIDNPEAAVIQIRGLLNLLQEIS